MPYLLIKQRNESSSLLQITSELIYVKIKECKDDDEPGDKYYIVKIPFGEWLDCDDLMDLVDDYLVKGGDYKMMYSYIDTINYVFKFYSDEENAACLGDLKN